MFPIVDSLSKDYDIDNCIADAVVQDTASVILRKRLREIVYAICVEITEHKISHIDFVIHLLEKVLHVVEMVSRVSDTLTCSIKYNNMPPVPASNDKHILPESSYKDFYKPDMVVTTDNDTADETESHADGTIQPDI